MKSKAADEVGIQFKHIALPAEASVDQVIATVKSLNSDESVSGILVQLPLGDHVNSEGERKVTEAIDPYKDVDGYVFSQSSNELLG
jgi:methylenetetrahydrofolate dehydrogenase (NADP+)/methenyltetrahydrofolate cyclohydrolase/formyltetrahydrofolate synthetase